MMYDVRCLPVRSIYGGLNIFQIEGNHTSYIIHHTSYIIIYENELTYNIDHLMVAFLQQRNANTYAGYTASYTSGSNGACTVRHPFLTGTRTRRCGHLPGEYKGIQRRRKIAGCYREIGFHQSAWCKCDLPDACISGRHYQCRQLPVLHKRL